MNEQTVNLRKFHFGKLLRPFLILLYLQVVYMACDNYPISVSNLTVCDDNNCFYNQYTSTSIDVYAGSQSCIQYESLDITPVVYNVSLSIDSSTVDYSLDNCYYTDDFYYSSVCSCSCPINPFSSNTCPCSAGHTAFPNNEFCLTDTVSAVDCIVGRTTDACCNIGISGTPRYYVCDVSDNPNINLQVTLASSSGDNCDSVVTNTNTLLQCGKVNATLTGVTFSSSRPGDKWIYDTLQDREYFASNSVVNGKDEYDPYKFGAIKFFPNGTIYYRSTLKNSIVMNVVSCLSNNIEIQSPTPNLVEIIPYSYSRNADSLPYMKSGVIFFDNSGNVNWMGVSMSGEFILGPNSILINNITLPLVVNGDVTPFLETGSTQAPYFNQSCSMEISAVSQQYEQITGWWISLVTCPGVRYFTFYQDNRLGDTYPFLYLSNDTAYHVYVNGRIYPNLETMSSKYFTLQDLFIPISYPMRSRSVDSMRTSVIQKATKGSALVTFSYSGTSVQFQNQVLKPKITSLDLSVDKQTLDVKAFVYSGKGSCLVTTNPQLTQDDRVDLTSLEQSFSLPLHRVEYQGNVTLYLACGRYSDSKTIEVDLNAAPPLSVAEQFSPYQWSGVPWYINGAKIAAVLIPLGILVIVVLKLFVFRKTAKTFSGPMRTINYMKKMN